MCAVALKRSPRNRRFALTGAKPAPYPGFIAPCDPTLRERAPEGSDWLHEIKIDGYRAQLHVHDGRVRCSPAAAMTGPSSSARSPVQPRRFRRES